MKAFICTGYGDAKDVLKMVELPTPTPKDNEIQICIRATTVNSGDSRLRRADPFLVRLFFGFSKPKLPILGIVVAGEITAIGQNVSRYKVGDAVFGMTEFNQLGAFAEYVCATETAAFTLKPQHMSFEEAAALPFGGHTVLDFYKKAGIQKDQKVLINGASGAVGTAAVQLAKYYGAKVTGICSTKNIELVRSIGADAVIDYTKTPLSDISERYDVVFDTIGQGSAFDFAKLVADNGTLILGSMVGRQTLQTIWLQLTNRRKKIIAGTVSVTAADMDELRKMAESGYFKAVIDTVYPFSDMVAAHNHVDTGRKRGNVVVAMQ
ncbi:MAG: NAD(P)-dependent alcohol dehydrogenase [Saprospiraceae bacterium]|nr:NAD(P)-dependent alcohol dehydrogenase [Saprospiraceae bacterium]